MLFDDAKNNINALEQFKFGKAVNGKTAVRVIVVDDDGADSSIKNTPKITNITAVSNAIEYEHTFQEGVKAFVLKSRTSTRMRISYTLNGTSSDYFTLDLGGVYEEIDVSLTNAFKIYFKCDNDNRVVEIIEWT